jgi:hypothetical protein
MSWPDVLDIPRAPGRMEDLHGRRARNGLQRSQPVAVRCGIAALGEEEPPGVISRCARLRPPVLPFPR